MVLGFASAEEAVLAHVEVEAFEASVSEKKTIVIITKIIVSRI